MRTVWRAFRTKPRHEKKVKDHLEALGLPVYCPLVKTRVRWSDRWKRIQKPVLPGYIFVQVDERHRLEVLQHPSVTATVFWNGKPAFIRDEEIHVMKRLLDDAEDVTTVAFSRGDQVAVHSGKLAGMEGVVLHFARNGVCLRLEGLGCEFVITVPKRFVEALSA